MAGTMSIRLSDGLPAMVVEVLSPDHETVKQLMLGPSSVAKVEVPSEASFIRLRLPSGRNVTLRHSGDLNYVVTREDIEGARSRPTTVRPPEMSSTVRQVREAQYRSSVGRASMKSGGPPLTGGGPAPAGPPQSEAYTGQLLPSGVKIEWSQGALGEVSDFGRQVTFSPTPSYRPSELRLHTTVGSSVVVRLPGNVDDALLTVNQLKSGKHVSLRVSTSSELADVVGGYLSRGDYYSAEAMTEWAESAERMLMAKMADPWAATVGAYLLFRLGRFDLMHDWARNLANGFTEIPDGCILWAMQSIQERKDGAAATEYLLKAVQRGLPVYTHGLKLLTQGLRLIGPEGEKALTELSKKTGRVLWTSPFTAVFEDLLETVDSETTVEIGYLARA